MSRVHNIEFENYYSSPLYILQLTRVPSKNILQLSIVHFTTHPHAIRRYHEDVRDSFHMVSFMIEEFCDHVTGGQNSVDCVFFAVSCRIQSFGVQTRRQAWSMFRGRLRKLT
jgi:hypothetical protein